MLSHQPREEYLPHRNDSVLQGGVSSTAGCYSDQRGTVRLRPVPVSLVSETEIILPRLSTASRGGGGGGGEDHKLPEVTGARALDRRCTGKVPPQEQCAAGKSEDAEQFGGAPDVGGHWRPACRIYTVFSRVSVPRGVHNTRENMVLGVWKY